MRSEGNQTRDEMQKWNAFDFADDKYILLEYIVLSDDSS